MNTRLDISVRQVAQNERSLWENLFKSYAKFYKTTVSDEGLVAVWGWIFDESNDFWCDVVEDADGKLIGFTQYQLMHRSLGGSMTCYLSDLYVDPSVRGSGAGRAMIDHVRAFAKDRGLPNVRWLTQENNYAARRLYDTYAERTDFMFYNIPT